MRYTFWTDLPMTMNYQIKLEMTWLRIALPVLILIALTSCDKPHEKELIKYYADKDKIEIIVEEVVIDSSATKEQVESLNRKILDAYIQYRSTHIGYSSENDFLEDLDSTNWEERKATNERVLQLRKNDFKRGVDSEDETVRRFSRILLAGPTYQEITLKYRTMKSGPLLLEKFSVMDFRDSVSLKILSNDR